MNNVKLNKLCYECFPTTIEKYELYVFIIKIYKYFIIQLSSSLVD